MIPFYIYGPVVLTLVSLHAWTFFMLKRRVERLQMALVAPGDSLDLRALGLPITIETSRATTVTVR